jgi:hypothetical protein
MTLLSDAIEWIGPKLKTSAGRSVTYTRGGVAPLVGLVVVPAHRREEITSQRGIRSQILVYVYTFIASELILGGQVTTPLEGDRIADVLGGQPATLEVMRLGSLPAWEGADTSGCRIRVYTKRVA